MSKSDLRNRWNWTFYICY